MTEIEKEFYQLREVLEINLSFLGEQSSTSQDSYWIVDDFYGEKIIYVYISPKFNINLKEILSEVIFATKNYKSWKVIVEFYEEAEVFIRGICVDCSGFGVFFDENKN